MRDMKKLSEKSREYRERYNPCYTEERLSYKCLEKNNYDKEMCNEYFLNINICREFWDNIRRERRMKGIKPELPTASEREQIKEEFLKNQKIT